MVVGETLELAIMFGAVGVPSLVRIRWRGYSLSLQLQRLASQAQHGY